MEYTELQCVFDISARLVECVANSVENTQDYAIREIEYCLSQGIDYPESLEGEVLMMRINRISSAIMARDTSYVELIRLAGDVLDVCARSETVGPSTTSQKAYRAAIRSNIILLNTLADMRSA